MSLELAWERETVATAVYLHSNHDPQVRNAMRSLEKFATSNKNGLVMHAREIEQKYELVDLFPVDDDIDRTKDPRSAIGKIIAKQRRRLSEERAGKVIHCIFSAEADKKGCDKAATFAWL